MMNPLPIIVGIDGENLSHFTSFEINQTIGDHHTFSLRVPHSVIEKPMAYTIFKAQNWLTKTIYFCIEQQNNFIGIITNIEFEQVGDLVGNQIIVSGYSKTIKLENGEQMYSWENKTLKEIIENVINEAEIPRPQLDVKPEYKDVIAYQTQYLESDFQFIQRLAKQYNERFYYDGEILHFGVNPETKIKVVVLRYGIDISKLNTGLQAKPTKFNAYTYNDESDENLKGQSNDEIKGLPLLGKAAFEASNKFFETPNFAPEMIYTGNEGQLNSFLKRRQAAAAADSNYVRATTRNRNLKIGIYLDIECPRLDKPNQFDTIGQYIITEIVHTADHLGQYINHFTALPAHISHFPEPNVPLPVAQMEQATVVDNKDSQGRIKVQMLWQQSGQSTPWLRVMTPDAGSSDKVGTNRGMVFIPEIGDHVMIGFRYNDPNRPFVMGSVFDGKIGKGGAKNNDSKKITTKSGSNIAFQEDKKSLTLTDAIGSSIALDGAGTIATQSSKSLTFTVGKSSLTLNADGKISLKGNIIEFIGETSISNSSKAINISGTDIVSVVSDTNVEVTSKADVTVSGVASAKLSSADTASVEGIIIKLN